MSNAVRTETVKGPIEFVRFFHNDYQKEGSITAELRMVVTTKSFYPSKRVSSDLQSNLFDTSDFGYGEKVYESTEKRMAWMIVPTSVTEEKMEAKLNAAIKNGATIYKIISHRPILDDNQRYAIESGIRSLDYYANSQATRFPETDETIANGTAKKLILTDGLITYRRTFFSPVPTPDVDERLNKNIEPYITQELKAEILGASVYEGQTI